MVVLQRIYHYGKIQKSQLGGEKMFLHKINADLSLKLIQLNDADRVFELTEESRSYLREWLPWLDTTTKVKDTKDYIKFCLKGFSENNSLTTVILFKGDIVGVASFNSINWSNKTAYIGYWLGHAYQGNGIMINVVRALTDYAFQELQLNKVEVRAASGNKKVEVFLKSCNSRRKAALERQNGFMIIMWTMLCMVFWQRSGPANRK